MLVKLKKRNLVLTSGSLRQTTLGCIQLFLHDFEMNVHGYMSRKPFDSFIHETHDNVMNDTDLFSVG